ncbi:hypothetical protein CDAR_476871 [Caerostris darwini]|uniref:Uncharacterized protein n=1 Tax=Caerostris darwini TaxID=1538125 RepID=A0AAV4U538_9ARAC|nr:hypothetical protein CDAR_476871 [Caerostris darwini]
MSTIKPWAFLQQTLSNNSSHLNEEKKVSLFERCPPSKKGGRPFRRSDIRQSNLFAIIEVRQFSDALTIPNGSHPGTDIHGKSAGHHFEDRSPLSRTTDIEVGWAFLMSSVNAPCCVLITILSIV